MTHIVRHQTDFLDCGFSTTIGSMAEGCSLSKISSAASWTAQFATGLVEAHQLGFGPGPPGSLLGGQFQVDALPLFLEEVPAHYVQAIANEFKETCWQMIAHGAPSGLSEPWAFLAQWFHHCADADTRETFSVAKMQELPTNLLQRFTPSVLPFTRLADIASLEGAAELLTMAEAVTTGIEEIASGCPLSESEIDLLRSLAGGERTADIAEALGYSERSIYRQLNRIWESLNVKSRAEGLAFAVHQGWI